MTFSATPTYAELKTALTNWLRRSDLTSYLDDLILMGEKWIFRKARTKDMETALSGTIASGVLAVPNDYVALKFAYVNGSPTTPLQPKSASWIYNAYPDRSSLDTPQFIARDQGNFIFGPYPDSTYSILGTYYKRLAAVASSANALFTANPDLYLFAALAEAAPFLKNDSRVTLWTAKRDAILQDVNSEDKEGAYGDGPLAVTAI